MPFKKVTAEKWAALGLPTETSTLHFGNTEFVKKLKEHQNKKKQKKERKKLSES